MRQRRSSRHRCAGWPGSWMVRYSQPSPCTPPSRPPGPVAVGAGGVAGAPDGTGWSFSVSGFWPSTLMLIDCPPAGRTPAVGLSDPSTMVEVSPLLRDWTVYAVPPPGSVRDPSTRHICGGLPGSWTVMSRSGVCPGGAELDTGCWPSAALTQASATTRAPFQYDRTIGRVSFQSRPGVPAERHPEDVARPLRGRKYTGTGFAGCAWDTTYSSVIGCVERVHKS